MRPVIRVCVNMGKRTNHLSLPKTHKVHLTNEHATNTRELKSKLSALRTHPNDKLLYIPKSGISRDQTILGFFRSGRAPGA